MTDAQKATFAWWYARLPSYNLGLIAAGILAFMAYVLAGFFLLPAKAEFEVTFFTVVGGGFSYLFMMVMANICYQLGPFGELFWAPRNPGSYRHFCFNVGFWGSCALPFSVPLLLVIQAVLGIVAD